MDDQKFTLLEQSIREATRHARRTTLAAFVPAETQEQIITTMKLRDAYDNHGDRPIIKRNVPIQVYGQAYG